MPESTLYSVQFWDGNTLTYTSRHFATNALSAIELAEEYFKYHVFKKVKTYDTIRVNSFIEDPTFKTYKVYYKKILPDRSTEYGMKTFDISEVDDI